MSELRVVPRLPVEKSGMMVFADGGTYPCIVTNVSGCGAKLSLLRNSRELPVEFSLSIDGRESYVRIVWRTRFHVGVQFVGAEAQSDTPQNRTTEKPERVSQFS